MTQRALLYWAGTEMITIEVANELSRSGHEVAVFSPRVGFPAKLMELSGVWIRSSLSEIPWQPDIIHGHHHLQTMAALAYFADTPAIYCGHGVIPWPESVPVHDRIRKYVVMCEGMVPRLEPMYGISRSRIAVVPNFVNTQRFSSIRSPASRLTRALLFGGAGFSDEELSRLAAACVDRGIFLDKIGYSYDNPQARPETFLPKYDLVFATGKCAIEALACGCAVIPIIPGQVGQLLTPDNFDEWAFTNFSPRYFRSGTQVSTGWLRAETEAYSPEATAAVSDRVRSTRSLKGAVDQFEQIYFAAIRDYKRSEPARVPGEFAPYLERLSAEIDIMLENEVEIEKLRADVRFKDRRIAELYQINENLRIPSVRYTLRRAVWTIAVLGKRYLSRLLNPPLPRRD
jgi:Glycosyltransferase Family 4